MAEAKKATRRVKLSVRLDKWEGKVYLPGDSVDLPFDYATRLINRGDGVEVLVEKEVEKK